MAKRFSNKRRPNGKNQRGSGKSGKLGEAKASENQQFEDNSGTPPADFATGGGSSFDWLNRYPQLSVAVGSLPFPNRPGMIVNAGSSNLKPYQYSVPGMCVVSWVPTIGASSDYSSAPSQVARELYAKVRSVYSSELAADGPDMLVDIVALDSISAFISWCKRVYRTLNAWTPDNYIIPDLALRAMGFSRSCINNMRENISDFGRAINEMVLQFNSFVIPDMFDIFHRHRWMSEHIYKDSELLYNSQLYMFNPAGFYQFQLTNTGVGDELASGCVLVPLTVSKMSSYQSVIQYGRDLLQAMYEWSTARTINGYFSRAFEGASKYQLAELGYDEVQVPTYDEQVLMQIENVSTGPMPVLATSSQPAYDTWTWNGLTISQNPLTNVVKCSNEYHVPYGANNGILPRDANPGLSIRNVAPTVAEVMLSSRLKVYYQADTSVDNTTTVSAHSGTEIPLHLSLWVNNLKGVGEDPYVYHFSTCVGAASMGLMTVLGNLSTFDWHPIVYMQNVGQVTADFTPLTLFGDVHNVTFMEETVLNQINRVCVLSEFNAFGVMN